MLLVFSRLVCPRGSVPVACLLSHPVSRQVYRPAYRSVYRMPNWPAATIWKAGCLP